MIVELNGKKLIVKWRHEKENRKTFCMIHEVTGPDKDDRNLYAMGVAELGPKEPFYIKEKGRIESFKHALNVGRTKKIIEIGKAVQRGSSWELVIEKIEDPKQLNEDGLFKREDRKFMWEQYFKSKIDPFELYINIHETIKALEERLIELEQEYNFHTVEVSEDETEKDGPRE